MSAIVFIGTGHAAIQCAASLRDLGHSGPITIIGTENDLPYHRPPNSKKYAIEGVPADFSLLRAADYYENEKIDLLLGETVSSIDPAGRQVTLDSKKSISFEKLIDINTKMNFVAVIYQESYNDILNSLLIYDIDLMAYTKALPINPNSKNMLYMFMDDKGFNSFKIVRSGELIDNSGTKVSMSGNPLESVTSKGNSCVQMIRFQVFTLYIETLGRI